MIRAVVDTNLLVRAVIKPGGTVGPVLGRLRAGEYVLIYSEPLVAELIEVLNRPRLRDKYGLSSADIETVVGLILLRGEGVVPVRRVTLCRDPQDNMVLEAAAAGAADVIASGDEDLLVLASFEGIPIVPAAAFLTRLDAAA